MKKNNFKIGIYILSTLLICSCQKRNEVVKEKWGNGNPKIVLNYFNNDSTSFIETNFFEDGNIDSEVTFVNNVKHGKSKSWHKNKQLNSEEIYENGVLKKFTYWYENGNKKGQGSNLVCDTIIDTVAGTSAQIIREFGNIVYWRENGEKDYEISLIDDIAAITKKWDEKGEAKVDTIKRKLHP